MRLPLIVFKFILIVINVVKLCDSFPTPTTPSPLDVQSFRETFAARMKSFMNTSVDPCHDFYEYACGNYPNVIEDNEITKKQNVLADLTHVIDAFVDEILQKERQPDELYFEELQTVKQYLESCNKAQLWPLAPSEEYLKVIETIGGFPAVDSAWNVSAFDWFNMTAHLIRFDVVGLIKEEIFLKHPFPPYYEIPRIGFDFDVYLDNIASNESAGYKHNVKIMKELLELYGVNSTKSDEVVSQVVEFWQEVVVYQDKAKDRRSCRAAALEDDLDEYEFPKWNSLFEIAWDAKDSFICDDCDCPCDWYFKKLDDMSANRSEAMANYMALKFLYTMHAQLKSTKLQHQHCVDQIKRSVPVILTHFYMKEHYSTEDQKEVEEIVVELKAKFIQLIETLDWLDDESRIGNTITMNTLQTEVGEIVDPMSDTYIREIKQLNLTENYDANNLELAKFRVNMQHYAFLQADLDENASPLGVLNAIQVNAFYNLVTHRVNVLAGIMFPPVFHRHLPQSVKYGSLGYIVGHEIAHSLEYRGRKFEKLFKNHTTYSEESAKVMYNRSRCFVEHHSNFTVPLLDIKLNRTKNTLESVADSGGLREAFVAYKTVANEKLTVKNNSEHLETLPGLDLSPEKTFFLSFAQVYCAKYGVKEYWNEIYADHPMDRYRVLSTLQHFEEFSTTYNCSMGTPMNPEKKCRVW
ncbi:neprilysin-like [Eupeodes corollae]|uniref:neprilysin-like n=1 Tax=Eupeodes corollae TaxID=290404 RepID=UPI0024901AD5|nr:neprilysin-like [Eupeodes corollae]